MRNRDERKLIFLIVHTQNDLMVMYEKGLVNIFT